MAQNIQKKGYHSTMPDWRRGIGITGKVVGIELEVEGTSGNNYERLIGLMPELRTPDEVAVESDGSLSHEYGMEIVFPPISYDNIKKGLCNVTKVMESLDGSVQDRFTGGNAGMHMSVNRAHWSSRKLAYFTAVIHNIDKNKLQNIGGRTLTGYCQQHKDGSYAADILRYSAGPCGHAYAAEPKGTRVELRFPRSTTNVARLKALVTFIELVEEFAEEMDSGGYEQPTSAEIGPLFEEYLAAVGCADSQLVLDWMANGRGR